MLCRQRVDLRIGARSMSLLPPTRPSARCGRMAENPDRCNIQGRPIVVCQECLELSKSGLDEFWKGDWWKKKGSDR